MGTVIDGGEAGAVTKKQRKLSLFNEMMQDKKVKKRAKTQYLKARSAPIEPALP